MRADAAANRAAILEAARTLFTERGPATSLRAVADEAGVGIATLYRHFPTPLDLRVGIIAELRTRIVEVATAAEAAMAIDPAAGWRQFAEGMAAVNLASIVPHLAIEMNATALPEPIKELRAEAIAAVGRVLDMGKAAGLADESVTAVQLQLGIAWITRPLPEITTDIAPGQSEWLLDTFLRGILPHDQ